MGPSPSLVSAPIHQPNPRATPPLPPKKKRPDPEGIATPSPRQYGRAKNGDTSFGAKYPFLRTQLSAMQTRDIIDLSVGALQIVAIFAAYFLALRQYRMGVTSQHFERFSRDFAEIRERLDSWLTHYGTDEERLNFINDPANSHLKSDVLRFSNFFQELGMSYKAKLTHHEYVHEIFSFLTRFYWGSLYFWIDDYRKERGRPSLFREWEFLNDKCVAHDRKKRKNNPKPA
jgi:hypothetical protein